MQRWEARWSVDGTTRVYTDRNTNTSTYRRETPPPESKLPEAPPMSGAQLRGMNGRIY